MLVLTDVDADRIASQRARDEFFWLDLEDPSFEEMRRAGEQLGLHPVALEDTHEWHQRPKIDSYGDYVLLVLYSARMSSADEAIPLEVHVYLSGSYVLTVRREPCTGLDKLHADLAEAPLDDEGKLVYRILDTLTDAWYPVIQGLERRIDALEDQVLLRARREHLREIYRLRQEVRALWRIGTVQSDHRHEVAEAIRDLPGLSQDTRAWLRDVGDHLVQIAAELSRQNDDLAALTATYFNANADRLNAVATRLTVIGTLFVVATIVTGFFGQNFGWLVHHINTPGEFLVWGVGVPLVLLCAAGAILWIKRRDLF